MQVIIAGILLIRKQMEEKSVSRRKGLAELYGFPDPDACASALEFEPPSEPTGF